MKIANDVPTTNISKVTSKPGIFFYSYHVLHVITLIRVYVVASLVFPSFFFCCGYWNCTEFDVTKVSSKLEKIVKGTFWYDKNDPVQLSMKPGEICWFILSASVSKLRVKRRWTYRWTRFLFEETSINVSTHFSLNILLIVLFVGQLTSARDTEWTRFGILVLFFSFAFVLFYNRAWTMSLMIVGQVSKEPRGGNENRTRWPCVRKTRRRRPRRRARSSSYQSDEFLFYFSHYFQSYEFFVCTHTRQGPRKTTKGFLTFSCFLNARKPAEITTRKLLRKVWQAIKKDNDFSDESEKRKNYWWLFFFTSRARDRLTTNADEDSSDFYFADFIFI